MDGENQSKPETKTCEACGGEFSCGARSEKCWCFEIDLSAENLAELKDKFQSCLCKNCLMKSTSAANYHEPTQMNQSF